MAEELRDIEPLRPLLAHSPLAILSDIDGTVAPIVDNPPDAHITDRARAAIQTLISRGVRVAFVTGRALEMARQMVNIPGVSFAANHGLTIETNGVAETREAIRPYVGWAEQVMEQMQDLDIPGLVVEDKGPVIALHYRNAESEPEAVVAILAAIQASPAAALFRLQQGRKVIELRPPLPLDKGTAVEDLVSSLGARAAITMGDDMTDMDMFRGIRDLRSHGIPGASIAVWSPELNRSVLDATDYWVSGVGGIEWMLEEIIKALPERLD